MKWVTWYIIFGPLTSGFWHKKSTRWETRNKESKSRMTRSVYKAFLFSLLSHLIMTREIHSAFLHGIYLSISTNHLRALRLSWWRPALHLLIVYGCMTKTTNHPRSHHEVRNQQAQQEMLFLVARYRINTRMNLLLDHLLTTMEKHCLKYLSISLSTNFGIKFQCHGKPQFTVRWLLHY